MSRENRTERAHDDPPVSSRPASLVGTDVDGGLHSDDHGHFVADRDALALFDYFLAATGEEPRQAIRARILQQIEQRLDPPADAQAAAFLDRYLVYRDDQPDLASSGAVPEGLERRLQWIRETRRDHFGPLAEPLFGLEEAATMIDLERRRVFTDPSLDTEGRAIALASLDARLPEAVRVARERARAPSRLHKRVRDLDAMGAAPEEIFALREAAYGHEAAERLAALDAERRTWRARYERYREERDRLLADAATAGLEEPADATTDPLEALRREHFEDQEVLRVRVLDRAAGTSDFQRP